VKIIALASSAIALPCLQYLQNAGMLSALVCPNREHHSVKELQVWAASLNVDLVCLAETDLSAGLSTLISDVKADLVLACSFPYQIPEDLLTLPSRGFLNIHFSKLPAYRGPSPVFWQIRNGETSTGISIHQMDSGWDTGKVLRILEVPIFPGETIGLCTARLSQLSVGLLKQLLQENLKPETPLTQATNSYYPRPSIADFTIDWSTQSATEIENLVNACNLSDGAITALNKQPVQLLEVSPADLSEPTTAPAGTIIHASTQDGLFVCCADGNALRINILKTREGIISGAKGVALGIREGMNFEQITQNIVINIFNH
jgi:methionyl-tRNA formyltransferase